MISDVPRLYRQLYPIIRERCRRLVGDDAAHDVAQETFLRVLKTDFSGDDVDGLTAWAYRVGTRLALDWLRTARLGPAPTEDLRTVPGPEAQVLCRGVLMRLSRQVDPGLLEVAVLSRVDGLTHLEIAEVLEVSERTVRRQLERFDALVDSGGLVS